jgi:hypothetical protein
VVAAVVMRKNYTIKLTLTIIVLFGLLAGCATPYQRKAFKGGYSEMRLGENIFQVSFRGNAYTHRDTASDFALLRSAEVALENGFRYFVIVESEKGGSIGSLTTPLTFPRL